MTKFSFNPFTGQFIYGGLNHAEDIRKIKSGRYDDFIRGIIIEGKLYLRTFYPFDGLENLTLTELNQKSYSLLFDNLEGIKKNLKKYLQFKTKDVIFNATNDLLGRNI